MYTASRTTRPDLRRRALAAAVAGASAVLLTACGGTGTVAAPEPAETSSSTGQPTPSETETVTETAPGSSPTETVSPPDIDCSMDYTDSDFGMISGDRSFEVTDHQGVTQEGFAYHVNDESVVNGSYDACQRLSFMVLNGMVGDEDGPAGTGASISSLVVLFKDGQTVTNPIPILFASVESVERVSPESITVTYGHRGGATAEGITDRYPVTYTLENVQVEVAHAAVPDDVWEGYYRVRVP